MKVEHGKRYINERGDIIKVAINRLPYYKFSAIEVNGKPHNAFGEHWTESGEAYHNDCKLSLVSEVEE